MENLLLCITNYKTIGRFLVSWVVFPLPLGKIGVTLDQHDHEDDTEEDITDNVDDDDRNDDVMVPHRDGHRDELCDLDQEGDGGGHAVEEGEAVDDNATKLIKRPNRNYFLYKMFDIGS